MHRRRIGLAIGLALALGALWLQLGTQAASVNTTMHGTFNPGDGSREFWVDSGPLQAVCLHGHTQDG